MEDFFGYYTDLYVSQYGNMTDSLTEGYGITMIYFGAPVTLNYTYPDNLQQLAEFIIDSDFITRVVTYLIIAIGMPLILLAIYSVYFMVQSDPVAPIYVINLLISDLLQLCCMFIWVVPSADWEFSSDLYQVALLASVCFMVSLSLERYMVIVHPLWYRIRRSIKSSVVGCAVVWIISIAYFFSSYTIIVSYILPFPVLIFCLVQTARALFRSLSVPLDEKLRIIGILVTVLLIYTLLFLPVIIYVLGVRTDTVYYLYRILLRLSPLADLVLYVFMRKGAVSKLLNSVRCCKMKSNDTETTTTDGSSRSSV